MILIENYQFLPKLFFFEIAFNVLFYAVLVWKGGWGKLLVHFPCQDLVPVTSAKDLGVTLEWPYRFTNPLSFVNISLNK